MKNAYLKLHTSVFLFGFTAILGKLITLQEGLLVWYRMMFTAISLGLILYFGKKFRKISKREILKISFVGFIIAVHWVTFYGAIKYSNVSITLSCFASTALFTALVEPAMTKSKVRLSELVLGLLAILGIYLIFSFQTLYTTGIIIALISALLASIFTVMNKKLTATHDTSTIVFWEITSGFLFLTILLPFYLQIFPSPKILPGKMDFFWLLIHSLLCTTLAFTLSMSALKELTPFTVNLAINLEPIYGIIMAFIIFHENKELSAGFYWGTAIILVSVFGQAVINYWVNRRKAKTVRRVHP